MVVQTLIMKTNSAENDIKTKQMSIFSYVIMMKSINFFDLASLSNLSFDIWGATSDLLKPVLDNLLPKPTPTPSPYPWYQNPYFRTTSWTSEYFYLYKLVEK